MSPIKRAVRFANRLRAIWKLCLSFRKRDWELADYPVVIRTQEPDPASAYHASRFKLNRYVASIVDWHLTGSGDSQEEALQNLRGTFAAVKLKKEETGEPPPGPARTFRSKSPLRSGSTRTQSWPTISFAVSWSWRGHGFLTSPACGTFIRMKPMTPITPRSRKSMA